uniref:Uncharacterized protein n=1 Tax=Anguilla anguilla TaxID=7936 RepID=A0A0E9QF08_ANGAN
MGTTGINPVTFGLQAQFPDHYTTLLPTASPHVQVYLSTYSIYNA